jgi:hypothetical protein
VLRAVAAGKVAKEQHAPARPPVDERFGGQAGDDPTEQRGGGGESGQRRRPVIE